MTSEFDLIEIIADTFAMPQGIEVGIGDDSAVLERGCFDLVAMDTLVEGVHFRRDWSSPEEIGWKALAVNLSDIAAMGGVPGPFFLSLAMPGPLDLPWVQGLLAGMKEAAEQLMPPGQVVAVVGGDTVQTRGPAVVTITVVGRSPEGGAILRRGAKVGDRIIALGALGLSAAGLAVARELKAAERTEYPAAWSAFQRPRPQIKAGIILGQAGLPTAMIDISDGLIQDLGHILRANRLGAHLECSRLQIHPELVALSEAGLGDPLEWILSGGEDFQLLMTISPDEMARFEALCDNEGWTAQDFGEARHCSEGVTILDREGAPMDVSAQGYIHFEAL